MPNRSRMAVVGAALFVFAAVFSVLAIVPAFMLAAHPELYFRG